MNSVKVDRQKFNADAPQTIGYFGKLYFLSVGDLQKFRRLFFRYEF